MLSSNKQGKQSHRNNQNQQFWDNPPYYREAIFQKYAKLHDERKFPFIVYETFSKHIDETFKFLKTHQKNKTASWILTHNHGIRTRLIGGCTTIPQDDFVFVFELVYEKFDLIRVIIRDTFSTFPDKDVYLSVHESDPLKKYYEVFYNAENAWYENVHPHLKWADGWRGLILKNPHKLKKHTKTQDSETEVNKNC